MMMQSYHRPLIALAAALLMAGPLRAQTVYKYEQHNAAGEKGATLTFFSKSLSQYIPHIIRQYERGKMLHNQIWWDNPAEGSIIQPPFMTLSDWEDDGNGGVCALPYNTIMIGMAPMGMSYFVAPSTERYSHLFKHEYTHTVMTDKSSHRDRWWRSLFGTKVTPESQYPLSSIWSYLTVPRWYSPRWYHEGIACFMETWLGGGVGRALGGYDEMYFRSLISEQKPLSTVVGLESEGTTRDFQLGTNAYLYGTRFVNYITMRYGYDKLIAFYNRTEDSHTFFATQFKKIYGRHLRDVWQEWQDYEREHQQQNLDIIRKYPLTKLDRILPDKQPSQSTALGSAAPLVIDESQMMGYTAVNYPGDVAHIEEINLRTGERRKLANIDGPMLYQTAFVALDQRRHRLFWTDRNSKMRGLRWITLSSAYNQSTAVSSSSSVSTSSSSAVSSSSSVNSSSSSVSTSSSSAGARSSSAGASSSSALTSPKSGRPSLGGLSPKNAVVPSSGHLTFQRTSDIVYDNANDCLYGLMSHEGVTYIVRYDATMEKRDILYKFPFGVSVNDLDVSHDGTMLSATIIGLRGQQSLILFRTDNLDNASFGYETLKTFEDSNLTQFRFSHDDKLLVGTSYYTGVANLWSIPVCQSPAALQSVGSKMSGTQMPDSQMSDSLKQQVSEATTTEPSLLTNTEIGIFAPYLAKNDSIYALEFTRNGMTPVRLAYKPITDCNAVALLGQKAYEKNPVLADIGKYKSKIPEIQFGEVYDSIKVYHPLKEMTFQGAYPDISGFTDRESWNKVTPVLGYHLAFADPLMLSSVNIMLGISPWSHNAWKNRFHAQAEWNYWFWKLKAGWNPTSFYDLFGPTRRSRKGYNVQLSYNVNNDTQSPFKFSYGASIATFGDMDALPLYQNVEISSDIRSFQTAQLHVGAEKTRTSLGGVTPEKGYIWNFEAYSYLAKGKLYPTVSFTYDRGFLLPFMRNTSAWLRTAIGQNFGDSDSAFGNEYFGGFGNNYVDNGEVRRYRNVNSMPGTEIDNIKAHSYVKAMGEFNLQPVRFRNVGMLCLYPTYAQLSLFATDLVANPWGKQKFNNYINVGAQLNFQVVLFNYMNTTWSFGYAHMFSQSSSLLPRHSGEWLISLKLL